MADALNKLNRKTDHWETKITVHAESEGSNEISLKQPSIYEALSGFKNKTS